MDVVEALPKGLIPEILGRQLVRSATSVGANYRAACRSRSLAEFIAKMGIVEEEADESLFWLELIEERKQIAGKKLTAIKKEASELTAIAVASKKSARKKT